MDDSTDHTTSFAVVTPDIEEANEAAKVARATPVGCAPVGPAYTAPESNDFAIHGQVDDTDEYHPVTSDSNGVMPARTAVFF